MRRLEQARRSDVGFLRAAADIADVFRDGTGAPSHELNVPRDLLGRMALCLYRGGDGGGYLGDQIDRSSDISDSLHGSVRSYLHVGDLYTDLLGGLGGLRSEGLDFRSNYRESAASFARARRFDRRI